jgi:hypothetical protein
MNEQDVVSFFTGKGYEPHQAAGIAGNLVQESSLNPTAKNPTSGAFGFAQWLGPRKKAFMDFAMKAKKDIKDPLAQLEFIDLELNTTERKAKDRLLASRDATEAAVNFSNHYERAGANEKKNATRANYANKILGAIIPSAQAGETMDKPLSFDEWVAAGKPKAQSTTSEIPTRKSNEAKPLSFEEWVAAGKPKAPGEKDSMSWGETATRAASNIFPSTGKLISDVAGAVTSPVETMEGLIQLTSGGMAKILPDFIMQYAVPEKRKQAVDVANAVGGVYKQKYGTEEGFKRALAEDPASVAADLSILLSGGSSLAGKAGLGRTANALATGAKYTNPLTPIIAGATAAAPVVGKAAAIPVNYLRDVTNPKLAALATAAEGKGQQIVNALRSENQIIPGSKPTAGQAASDVGATRYSALQAEVAKQLPTEYLERANQQAAARVAQIQTVGKTEAELNAAKALRAGEARINYGLSDPEIATANRDLTVLLDRPSMDKAVARAKALAKEKGDKFQIGSNAPEQQIMVKDPLTMTTNAVTVPEKFAQYTGKDLHYLKLALDDLIKNPAEMGIGANEARAIGDTRTAFLNWAESKIPAYGIARETYAAQSKPINRMEVGQYLQNKLTGPLSEEKLRPGVFATAVKEAPTTLKRVTGESRFNKLDQILTPIQMEKVKSVIDDLARDEKFNIQARAGAKAGEVLPATAIGTVPNWLNKVVTATNMIITRLQGKIDKATAIDLATEMLNPAKAATAMEKALARQSRGSATMGKVKEIAKSAGEVAKKPSSLAVSNTLATQQQQNALAQ